MERFGLDRDVLALGVARMADAVANSFLVVVLPLYIASQGVRGATFGLTESALTGIILAVFGFANAGLQPFAGRLSDRTGRRKLFVLLGLLALAALNATYTLAGSYATIFAIRLGQGLCVAFTVTASVALVNELSVRGTRGGNMGTYNSLRLVGFGTGPLVAGFVVESGPYGLPGGIVLDGFEAAFAVATVGALLGAAMVALMVRDPERTEAHMGELELPVLHRTGDRLFHPIFILGVATLVMAACIALLASIEPIVNEHLGQDARWFGVQFAVFILSLAVIQPLVGKASDHWGRRGFVVWGLVFLAPTTLAQGLAATPWQMVFARLAQGGAGAMVFAPALALAGDLTTEGQSGLQLSVLTMAFGLGLSAGQLLSGFLVEAGYLVPFAVGGSLALAAAGLVWREVEEPA